MLKESARNVGEAVGATVLFPGSGRSPGEYSSILAWKIPWTEVPEGLQFMGSQRVRCDLANTQRHFSVQVGLVTEEKKIFFPNSFLEILKPRQDEV